MGNHVWTSFREQRHENRCYRQELPHEDNTWQRGVGRDVYRKCSNQSRPKSCYDPRTSHLRYQQKVRVKLGPYFSYVTSHKFSGYAYNGYIRVREDGHPKDDPTGQKVELGNGDGSRGDYDFSTDMRNWQFGIDAGADWYITKRWGASVGLTWGLSEIFKKDFDVIEQPLYPIYGTIGIIYQLK